ncbi:MAG: phenylalanine--tRNA ligase subunit beta [Gemmatimonadales bacterium]
MKVSHEWLRAFVPHALSPAEVGDLLTRHVVSLDGIERLRADLADVVVARVIESEKIPDTKLSFNKVDDGSGALLEVVCGAPVVTVGTLYPFARAGTMLPGGLKLERRKIRGFTSNGMLCSARELKLGADHEGIMALDVDVPPGTPLLDAMPIGDSALDLDVLPNRPDLLSHLGVAREVGSLTGIALRQPPELDAQVKAPEPTRGATTVQSAGASVTVEDLEGCPRYVAAVIRGVTVGPSPEWLSRRVESVGGRSINNVVDATNYVLHGLGQPVHAFDLATLTGGAIVVRKAIPGERLTTLDGEDRALQPWMTIIADGQRATALAGVMGGRASEVTASTKDVLLEVASFAPRSVRAVRRALGISTDASYRFERGVDGGNTADVAALAAGLIVAVAGGTIEALLDVGAAPRPRQAVALHPSRVERLLGAPVPASEITRLLTGIGFATEPGEGGALAVVAPSWRHDVARDVDLVEEVARLRGFDVLPDDLRPYRPGTVPDHPLYLAARRVRDALVAAGLAEVRPMPFTKGGDAPHARVSNPLAEDEPFLRTSLLDTLARRAEFNLNRHEGNVRLFEIGSAFEPSPGALPRETLRVGALLMGERRPPHFSDPKPPRFDAWDAKGLAQAMAGAAFAGAAVTIVPADADALWIVRVDGHDAGSVRALALDGPVWAAPAFGVEIVLGVLPSAPEAPPGAHAYFPVGEGAAGRFVHFRPLATTPAAEFDLALLVPNDLAVAVVEQAIRRASGELLERLALFDEFRGEGVPDGKRSVAWRLTLRHPERTLRDKEIEGRRAQLLKTLESELGVVPRTA